MRSRRRRAASAKRGTMSEDVCGTADQRLRCDCESMCDKTSEIDWSRVL